MPGREQKHFSYAKLWRRSPPIYSKHTRKSFMTPIKKFQSRGKSINNSFPAFEPCGSMLAEWIDTKCRWLVPSFVNSVQIANPTFYNLHIICLDGEPWNLYLPRHICDTPMYSLYLRFSKDVTKLPHFRYWVCDEMQGKRRQFPHKYVCFEKKNLNKDCVPAWMVNGSMGLQKKEEKCVITTAWQGRKQSKKGKKREGGLCVGKRAIILKDFPICFCRSIRRMYS